MIQFRVIAAKNDQRVELIISHPTEEAARESLHAQWYSIIEIKKLQDLDKNSGNFFYFTVKIWSEEKSGKIESDDIFRAYVKLVDDLNYDVKTIFTDKDITDEEKLYVTAKTKETYAEYKRQEKIKAVPEPENKQDGKVVKTEDKKTVLEKEVLKYQTVIIRVIQKLENFVEFHSETFWGERTAVIKELLVWLKQLKQSTNIAKLKMVGEAVLLKIGKLELEISHSLVQKQKDEFLKQTNGLLRELGSNKQVWGNIEEAKDKLKSLFSEVFAKNEQEITDTKEKKTQDQSSYSYFKNLRDLSIYRDKLKETKKVRLIAFFKNRELYKKLSLKERLIIQNIAIIEARIQKKKFSYSRLSKGFSYYNSVFSYLLQSFVDVILQGISVAVVMIVFMNLFQWWKTIGVFWTLSGMPFLLVSLFLFVFIFSKTRTFLSFGFWIGIFSVIFLLLRINF
jgi:hypothetical protein